MVERMAPLDSARQIVLETISTDILTVDEGWFLKTPKSGMFLIVPGEPVEIQGNGWHHWIRSI